MCENTGVEVSVFVIFVFINPPDAVEESFVIANFDACWEINLPRRCLENKYLLL